MNRIIGDVSSIIYQGLLTGVSACPLSLSNIVVGIQIISKYPQLFCTFTREVYVQHFSIKPCLFGNMVRQNLGIKFTVRSIWNSTFHCKACIMLLYVHI